MAAKGTTGAPTSASEGFSQIAQAITMTMLAPDAGPYRPVLDAMLKATVAATQHQQTPPQGPPQGGPPGGAPPGAMPPGGAMMGGPPGQPPGPGGPGAPSGSGISPDAARQLAGQMAATGA